MLFFKIIYLLSGKYKSVYKAKIVSWQDNKVEIIDMDGKKHILKAKFIQSIKRILPMENKSEEKEIIEQQKLF